MKYLFFSILILLSFYCRATNYYFSNNNGIDSRSNIQAQNSATPWKTIDKLNSNFSIIKPGDSILFKRGEIFYGSLLITNSGTSTQSIIFGAYGDGDKPIITGLTTLNGWIDKGNGIWESNPCPQAGNKVNMLILNGINVPMGRYPNADSENGGFLTYSAHNGNISITDSLLPTTPNWTGAQLILKKERWSFDRCSITSHAGNTLNYTFQTDYEPNDGFGYFIQNDIRTLDKIGEWYFNSATKTVSLFYGSQTPPPTIDIATITSLVNLKFMNFITFENLNFKGSNGNLLEFGNQQNALVKNCALKFAGIDAVYGYSLINFTIQNSTVNNANNNGIYMEYNCKFTNVIYDTIKNIGLFIGMGDAIHYNTFAGISVSGSGANASINTTIQGNVIDSIGYNGIAFIGDNALVKNNFVSNFCMSKDDGGGIYCHRGFANTYNFSGQKIEGNIVLDGQSAMNGIPNKIFKQTWGIYIDDNTQGIDIVNNTVANMPSSGIFLHNSYDITIKGNTLYNNAHQLRFSYDNTTPIRNVTVRKNIFYANTSTQLTFSFSSIADDMKLFGSSDSNIFSRPMDTTIGYIRTNEKFINLEQWKDFSNQDIHSILSTKMAGNLREIEEQIIFSLLNKDTINKKRVQYLVASKPKSNIKLYNYKFLYY